MAQKGDKQLLLEVEMSLDCCELAHCSLAGSVSPPSAAQHCSGFPITFGRSCCASLRVIYMLGGTRVHVTLCLLTPGQRDGWQRRGMAPGEPRPCPIQKPVLCGNTLSSSRLMILHQYVGIFTHKLACHFVQWVP